MSITVVTRKTLSTFKGLIKPSNYIASLNIDGWWRAGKYVSASGTWNGTASAGTSGSRAIAATNSSGSWPTDGAALNGKNTVSFARASAQRIVITNHIADYTAVNNYLWWALIKQNSASGASSKDAAYSNNALISDSDSYIAMATSTTNSGVAQIYQWDGAGKGSEYALSNSAWAIVMAYYDGTTQAIRVNSNTWQTRIVGNITGDPTWSTNALYLGCNYTTAVRWDGLMADIGMTKQITSNYQSVCDNIKAQLNSDYGLSL